MPIAEDQEYDALIVRAQEAEHLSQDAARALVKGLIRYREFGRVTDLADDLLVFFPDDPTITKAYAQALIETGKPVVARDMLRAALACLSETHREYDDIHGVLGRAYKEIYLSAQAAGRAAVAADALASAYACYDGPFQKDRAGNYYHGINLVALHHLARAHNADHQPPGDGVAIARELLVTLDAREDPNPWEQATRVEARIAIEDWPGAEAALKTYIDADYMERKTVDAFELFSTMRQLRDIWKIGAHEQTGRHMLRMLEAAALARSKTKADIDSHVLHAQTAEARATLDESEETRDHLEKMFGADGLQTYKWFEKGLGRARSVACVLDESEDRRGTAFVIDPEAFGVTIPDGHMALMTNHHVLNEKGHGNGALWKGEASVRFDIVGDDIYPVEDILFEDQPFRAGLDATIFTIKAHIDGVAPLPTNFRALPRLPQSETDESRKRVYLIGYPLGGELQFSLQDNHLLDHEGAPDGTPPAPERVRLHYFAPTEPGNSGSPVFNDNWDCIALHHAGKQHDPPKSSGMKKLNGKDGRYSANEGIWIGSIRDKIPKN